MNYKGEELYDPEDLGDYLAHFGRKGMKWYQHIFGEFQSAAKYAKGKGNPAQKKAPAKTEKSVSKPKEKKQNHKKMSNEELQKRIDRMSLEKQYLDLNKETRTNGKRFVDTFLKTMEKTGFDILQQSLTQVGKKYVSNFLDKRIDDFLKSQEAQAKKEQSQKDNKKKK